MNKKNRYLYVDYIKTTAILLVIIYHCKIFNNDSFIAAAIMSICVPLFFAVNGFLMLKKERSIKDLTYKNLKILFLIVFWGIFTNLCLELMWGGWSYKYKVHNNESI